MTDILDILLKQLFLSPSWAIDSEPIRATGIIVRYYVFEQSQKERRWKKNIRKRLGSPVIDASVLRKTVY